MLVAGANGAAEGMTTGTAYWVGDWDGERFTADGTGHQWLDHGADYYAAVTWDDPRLPEAERLSERYSIGWMNNWAYAGRFPTEDWQGGSDSIVRSIRLGDRRRAHDAVLDAGRGAAGAGRCDAHDRRHAGAPGARRNWRSRHPMPIA